MIDGIGVCLVDGDDVLDVLGYVVDSTPEDHQLHLKSTLLVVLQMQEVLGNALPIQVVSGTLCQVYAKIYVLWIEDILYSELHLKLEEDVSIEIELDVIFEHYLDAKWQFDAKVSVLCCSDGYGLRVYYTDIVHLIAPQEIQLNGVVT